MDVDKDVTRWLLDFLIRQPVNDRTLNDLLRVLPIPSDDLKLQKLLLLRKLSSDVSRRSISEATLELLEQLEGVESRLGNEVSDVMKRAYCLAAVDCTLRLLTTGEGGDEKRRFNFFEMVKRLWVGKIGVVEKFSEESGLGSDLLWDWKDDIEAAVWDDGVCKRVVQKFEEVRAAEAIRDYLREESEGVGPSFLELVAENLQSDDGLQKLMRDNEIDPVAEVENPLPRVDEAPNGSNVSKETQKGNVKHRDKLVGVRRFKKMASARGAKIDGSDEAEPSNIRYDLPGSAEVNKAREALESSSMELRAAVNDPLPEALRVAEAISKLRKAAEDNNGGPENVPKPSLMERNTTAQTFEWDDSIDGSPDDIACRAELHLPSPKKIKTSPLKVYEFNNNNNKTMKQRRIPRKWSLEEEGALREGVQKFGRGSWKVILYHYQSVFDRRTEVDLKDKWRNLMK